MVAIVGFGTLFFLLVVTTAMSCICQDTPVRLDTRRGMRRTVGTVVVSSVLTVAGTVWMMFGNPDMESEPVLVRAALTSLIVLALGFMSTRATAFTRKRTLRYHEKR